jgi:tetratricopeptide (TPR) repeat protein
VLERIVEEKGAYSPYTSPTETLIEMLTPALRHYQNGELQEAERAFLELLQADKENAETLYYLGLIAHKKGSHHDAINYLRKSIAINPRPGNLSRIRKRLQERRDIDQATDAYRHAIDAILAWLRQNLGDSYFQQNRLDEAYMLAHDTNRRTLALQQSGAHCGVTNSTRESLFERRSRALLISSPPMSILGTFFITEAS